MLCETTSLTSFALFGEQSQVLVETCISVKERNVKLFKDRFLLGQYVLEGWIIIKVAHWCSVVDLFCCISMNTMVRY